MNKQGPGTAWLDEVNREQKKMRVEPAIQLPAQMPAQPSLWVRSYALLKVPEWFTAFRTNPAVVNKTPIVTTFLLEFANVGQLYRMWTQQTAAGQSLWSWMAVSAALVLWLNFYLVFNRDNKFAIWGTRVGIGLNAAVCLTIVWFRYFVHVG